MTLQLSDLWTEQRQAVDFLYERDHSLLLADIGMGKTVMVLTVLKAWLEEEVADRVLVLAPTRVCQQVWRQECGEWAHLRHTNIANLAGESLHKRKQAIEGTDMKYPADILLINYELLPWFMAEYPDGAGCNVLVCDEIDKLKSPKSQRFKGGVLPTGKRVPGMKRYRGIFDSVIGMTGTPVPNHLIDLWAQVFTVDGGKRLGDNFYRFRDEFFYPKKSWGGFTQFEPREFAAPEIEDCIADITYRIESSSASGVRPEVRELPVRWLELPRKLQEPYREMEKHFITDVGANTVTALNAGVQYGKLRQFAQGFVYTDEEGGFDELSSFKLKALDELISELQGQQLLIVYHYQAQAALLKRRYRRKIRFLGGGVSQSAANKTIDDWNAGRLQLLAVHPQSAGHGLNLQKSGAHHIVMLTLPETAGEYKQVVGRLARTSNKAKYVMIHRILAKRTVDADRVTAVHEKIVFQDDLLDRMKGRHQ